MKQHSTSFGIIAALAVGAVLSPMASYTLLGSVGDYQENPFAAHADAKRSALRMRGRMQLQQRAFKESMDACAEERRVTGEDIKCADVNDTTSYQDEIRALRDGSVSGSAPRTATSKLDDLSVRERAIVEQSAQSGSCSLRLAGQGLYRLCEELRRELGQDAQVFGGFMNDRAARGLREAAAHSATLRARIQQVQDAFHGSAPEGRGDYRLR
jgi:hypothetical protein